MTPQTAACQTDLSFTLSQSLLKLMSIESVTLSNHFVLSYPFSSCPQSIPASGSFPMNQPFTAGGQCIGASASESVLTPWTVAHRFLCPWNFPGKNIGVVCHFLLQEIFPSQESNPHLLHRLHWQVNSLPVCHLGSLFTICHKIYKTESIRMNRAQSPWSLRPNTGWGCVGGNVGYQVQR